MNLVSEELIARTPGADQLVDWLIGGLELDSAALHVGQYCGPWHASTAGKGCASFHLVLRGNCHLHWEGRAPVALGRGDAVLLLRDVPHSLRPDWHGGSECAPQPMLPLRPALPQATSLACGFFRFRGRISRIVTASLPEWRLFRARSPDLRAAASLFELILAEADRGEGALSPMIMRLVELLLFYLVRDLVREGQLEPGLAAPLRHPRFAVLVERLLGEPGRDWSVEQMARIARMSRAGFAQRFLEVSGQPPAQFLRALRMSLAARRLRDGDSVLRAAEHVGYQSQAAFTRAFAGVFGERPGRYRRAYRHRREGAGGPAAGWAVPAPPRGLDDRATKFDSRVRPAAASG